MIISRLGTGRVENPRKKSLAFPFHRKLNIYYVLFLDFFMFWRQYLYSIYYFFYFIFSFITEDANYQVSNMRYIKPFIFEIIFGPHAASITVLHNIFQKIKSRSWSKFQNNVFMTIDEKMWKRNAGGRVISFWCHVVFHIIYGKEEWKIRLIKNAHSWLFFVLH